MTFIPGKYRDYCFQSWAAFYGTKPLWNAGHYNALQKCADMFNSEEQAHGAWDVFMDDDTKFFAGHCPRKFYSQLSTFVAKYAMTAAKPAVQPKRVISEAEQVTINERLDRKEAEIDAMRSWDSGKPAPARIDKQSDEQREVARKALREIREVMRR